MPGVSLRPITAADQNAIFDILRDPSVRLPFMLFSEPHFNRDTVTGWCTIAEQCNQETTGIDQFYAICDNRKLVGYFGGGPDTEKPDELDRWEIGYFLSPSYQGRGIISGIIADFKVQVKKGDLAKVFCATVHPDNHTSQRVLQKNGFIQIGVDYNWAPHILNRDGSGEQVTSAARTMNIFECVLKY